MKKFPRIALCQINPTVGDLRGNAAKISRWIKKALEKGAELVVFPELALTGYPPKDLLLKTRFLEEQRNRLEELASQTDQVPVVVGCVDYKKRDEAKVQNLYDLSARIGTRRLYNAAAVLRDGKVERFIHKKYLPDYDVFDEKRYFESQFWRQNPVIALRSGTNVMITICEDVWVDRILSKINWAKSDKGAHLLVNISASPFYARKFQSRLDLLSTRAKETGLPLIYVNMVGGQDDLIFDGRSAVVDARGRTVGLAKGFGEELLIYQGAGAGIKPEIDQTKDIWDALLAGIRDYARKNGFTRATLGVSGGIDSALVACLAAEALGSENVLGLVMPSRYTSKLSLKDALLLANNLRIKTEPIPIDDLIEAYKKTLGEHMDVSAPDVTVQNIQARIRGNLLMAFSNKFGHLVLTTGNKSELAVGYSTLYGDMAGGLAPIGDLPKTTVYELARWFNQREKTDQIPIGIMERAPSAELAPGQRDDDDLPPYEVLDKVAELYVEEQLSSAEIVEQGFDEKLVRSIIDRIDHAEYKRRQAPPILKITPRAFGFGRRMPITNGYEG